MKKYIFLISFIMWNNVSINAQTQTQKIQDDESVVILKEIQHKLNVLKTAHIIFSLRTEKDGKTLNITKGQIWIKGDKYKLIIPTQHVYCDSITIWNYLPQQNEVNISLYDPKDEENAINPIKLISNYQKYYRSAFIRESTDKGIPIQVIDLYPKKATSFFKIRLIIDKKKKELIHTSVSERNGYIYTYTFETFIKNPKIDNQLFIFNPSHYSDIEIIDMR